MFGLRLVQVSFKHADHWVGTKGMFGSSVAS